MKKFFVYLSILSVCILLILSIIIPINNGKPDNTAEVPITALKQRCSSIFNNEQILDDFLNFIEYNDEEGTKKIFAVYYRLHKNGECENFFLVPDKEAEDTWMSYLTEIKDMTAKKEELYQYNFFLQEDMIWITSSAKKA